MDGHTTFLLTIIAVQFYLTTEEIRSLMANGDASGHLQTLSTNAINVISTSLTAMYSTRLRRIRHSFGRIDRSLQITVVDDHHIHGDWPDGKRWAVRYQPRAWLMLATIVFGYLKYGQLVESDSDNNAYATAITALLQTLSMTGNYYVTVMFLDHVSFEKRALHTLNVQITDTMGSSPTSFYTGFTVSIARQAYLDICNNCSMVTQVFQTQLFGNIVDNVFGITFMMLSAFNTLMYDSTYTIRTTLYYLYDSLIRALQMYFIIDVCHTTVQQANCINITFQKKINEYTQINFTKRKVQLFIMEMFDQKVEFIVYGFICLNFEMFVSIMGTITTYFLILVQLGSSPDDLEKSTNVTIPLNNTTK